MRIFSGRNLRLVSSFTRTSCLAQCLVSVNTRRACSTIAVPGTRTNIRNEEHLKLEDTCEALYSAMSTLLEDRQCLYRSAVLDAKLNPLRRQITELLQQGITPSKGSSENTTTGLTDQQLASWRDAWLRRCSHGLDTENRQNIMCFYNAVLMSTAVSSDVDVRLILQRMRYEDNMEPDAESYVAILLSLLAEQRNPNATVGDTAFYYFGHALKKHGNDFVTDKLWCALFVVCSITEAARKIVDQWWDLLVKISEEKSSPLPYGAVHAALTWCSANRDVEHVMRFFHTANEKGLIFSGRVIPAGGLTKRSDDVDVQMCQLKLLVKLMVTVKSIKMDGGIRDLVVKDIRRLIDPSQLRSASWGVINDLLSGLSMPSGMQLLKFCSAAQEKGDGAIPFVLWASLLRRCSRDHHIDQAEALFFFIRKRFELKSEEKGELVEIMMRMFATLPQGDFASAMDLFLEHVIRHPTGEPVVKANETMYNLLIRAADSRNAAMMTFLEACASGISMSEETFEAVISSNPYATMASLSRRLPYDYSASKLDEQLHIPANVDAHLRREEALRTRGRAFVDSTGEVN